MPLRSPVGVASAPNAVVLLSGGLDSAVALACAKAEGFHCWTISFDYGQRHAAELAAAARIAESLGVPSERRTVVKIDLRAIGGSALTSDAIDVPKGRGPVEASGGIPATYVPARNLIFLSCAAGFAETVGARDLFIGVNAVDYSGYPDCREEFIAAFERAMNLGTKAGVERAGGVGVAGFRVHTPLVRLTKAQIIRRGVELGVNLGLTHSCYDPSRRPAGGGEGDWQACGACDSCRIRAAGFQSAGVPDPTRYA